MAVINVAERFQGCSASQEQKDLRIAGVAVRVFEVSFDDNELLPNKQIAALTASYGGVSVPAILDAHPNDANWFVFTKTARPDVSGVHWIVDVNYQYMENPFTRLAEIDWDFTEEPAIVENDITGKAVASSAGEPFDPPIQEMACDIVGRISYAASQFDGLIAANYIDAVNDGSLRIDQVYFPAYTVKINKWKGKKTYWGTTAYWEVYLEIQIRLAYKPGTSDIYGWQKQILDQGFYRRGTFADAVSGGTIIGKVPIRNRDIATIQSGDGINADDQVSSPVLLDGNGGILAEGSPPVFLYFETKKRRNFNIFNLRW
jgi:hypothetical protein